jgi:hypothetical protein
MPDTRRSAPVATELAFVAVPLFAVVAHLASLRDQYTTDDPFFLTDNPSLRSLHGLGVLVRSPLFAGNAALAKAFPFYRPLSSALYWVSYQLFGASPLAQHALNLGLFAIVASCCWFLLVAVAVRPIVATGLVLVLAAHPATSEVVAYVSGRQDLLGWALALAAMALGSPRGWGRAWLVEFLLVLLAMLSQDFFLVLPAMMACLAWGGAPASARAAPSAAVGALARGALAAGVVMGLRALFGIPRLPVSAGWGVKLPEAAAALSLRWLKVLVAPTDLSTDVTLPDVPLAAAIACLVVLLAVGLLIGRWALRHRGARAGLVLASLVLLAYSVLVHAGRAASVGVTSDRYCFSFLVGCLLLASGVRLPRARLDSPRLARALPMVLPVMALVSVPSAWARDLSWHDDDTLVAAEYASRPDDPQVARLMGERLLDQGDVDRGYAICKAAAEADPRSDRAFLCLGLALLLQHEPAAALPYLRAYATTNEERPLVRRAYLAALLATGADDDAKARVDAWLPRYPDADELLEAQTELVRRGRGGAALTSP